MISDIIVLWHVTRWTPQLPLQNDNDNYKKREKKETKYIVTNLKTDTFTREIHPWRVKNSFIA